MTSSNLPTSISVSYQTILKANLSVVKNMLVCEAVLVSLSQGQSTWMVTTKKDPANPISDPSHLSNSVKLLITQIDGPAGFEQ